MAQHGTGNYDTWYDMAWHSKTCHIMEDEGGRHRMRDIA